MLRLQSRTPSLSDVVLVTGVHDLVRDSAGQWHVLLQSGATAMSPPPGQNVLVRFRLDARGLWLQVLGPAVRVHLNGRPVSRLAHLRGGDVLHVDGQMLCITGRIDPPAKFHPLDGGVLRAVGGRWHGRGFALLPELVLGLDADGVLQLPAKAGSRPLARVVLENGRIVLDVLADAPIVLLNGQQCRKAELMPGDQLAVGTSLRLVLETGVCTSLMADHGHAVAEAPADTDVTVGASTHRERSMPWLLLAALLSAAVLAALLLYGTR